MRKVDWEAHLEEMLWLKAELQKRIKSCREEIRKARRKVNQKVQELPQKSRFKK